MSSRRPCVIAARLVCHPASRHPRAARAHRPRHDGAAAAVGSMLAGRHHSSARTRPRSMVSLHISLAPTRAAPSRTLTAVCARRSHRELVPPETEGLSRERLEEAAAATAAAMGGRVCYLVVKNGELCSTRTPRMKCAECCPVQSMLARILGDVQARSFTSSITVPGQWIGSRQPSRQPRVCVVRQVLKAHSQDAPKPLEFC
eukprot:SAG31_NODE_6509_length_1992_cov_0.970417_2_plen_202_part_00